MTDALRNAGNQLAALAFNLAQKPGYRLTGDDVALMDKLRRQWDDARAEATRTALAAPAVPPGWRPIETAPKDEAVLTLNRGRFVIDAWLCSAWGHWVRSEMGGTGTGLDPTHWMPLPAAPTAQQEPARAEGE